MPRARRPRRSRLSALLTLLAASCVGIEERSPLLEPPRPRRQYSVEQFLATVTYGGASFSPDGSKILVHGDASGVFNLYAVPVDGGQPLQLTRSTSDSLYSAGYFPDDERLLYRADRAGNELDHLYVREVDGRTRDLTPGEGHRAIFHGWADDHRHFYLSTNEREPRFFDLYQVEAATYRRELVLQDEHGRVFADASPDGRWLALVEGQPAVDADLYFVDGWSGQAQLLTAPEGAVAHQPLAFGPAGRRLLYLTDEGHEFQYLVELDLMTAERRVLDRRDGDVLFASYSRGGRYLVEEMDVEARRVPRVIDNSTGEELPLPELPGVEPVAVEFATADSAVALYAASPGAPQDLFLVRPSDEQPRQLTYALNPEIDVEDLVAPQVVRFPSVDGLQVPGLIYRPHRASAAARVPAVVWVHDGPWGQSRVEHDALIQLLVNHGYGVLAVNHRGSSGHGKTLAQAENSGRGADALDDCVAGRTMLAASRWVDDRRIGIAGRGEGGRLVVAALARRPEAFAAGVDFFAPLFEAAQIRSPLLVLHAANDPRLPRGQADELAAVARASGAPVETLMLEEDGRRLEKKASRERAYAAVLEFLDRTLRAD